MSINSSMMRTISDLTSFKFERLTVVRHAGYDNYNSSMWLCLCDCGNRVHVRRGNLLTGNTRSCGCLKSRHGHAKQRNHTPEYISWERAKRRCLDKNDMYYHLYGGRGITFCEHWLIFENFLKDMGERPDGHTLDRIDNSRGYEPNNCRWATVKEQSRNRRTNRWIEAFGQRMIFKDAADKYNISQGALTNRLKTMTPEEALTQPLAKRRPRKPACEQVFLHHKIITISSE